MKDERHHLEEISTRVKEELPEFLEKQFGHIEQRPPNRPSFLLVVLLSAGVIIIIAILAVLILHLGGANTTAHPFRKHPTSQLIQPPPPAVPVRWTA